MADALGEEIGEATLNRTKLLIEQIRRTVTSIEEARRGYDLEA